MLSKTVHMTRIRSACLLLLFLISFTGFSQTFTAKPSTPVSPNSNGFYEYLPQGYDPGGTETYPLLIFCHGSGESGNGDATELSRLVIPGKGLAALLNTGSFPTSFTVASQTFRFIILCPQFTPWPSLSAGDIDAVISYATTHYKVNSNRIYLTGLSMGGGMTWEYAAASTTNSGKLAAIVPICGAVPDGMGGYLTTPDAAKARNITNTNLPVWATHNQGDNVVPVSYTTNYVDDINAAPAPTPTAKKTIFTSWTDAHDAWTQTYDPAFTESGMNIYQWMLQYQRSFSSLPVSVSNYRAFVSAPEEVTVQWSTKEELNNDHFTVEWSADGIHFSTLATLPPHTEPGNYSYTDRHAVAGDNFYRLSETEKNGQTRYFDVLKVTLASAPGRVITAPNPVASNLVLKLRGVQEGALSISLLSASGTMLQHWNKNISGQEGRYEFNLSAFPRGIYLLHIRGKGIDETRRVVRW